MEMINLHNYMEVRMNNLLLGIREIHKAGVEHNDIRPRNMLIVKDDPNPDRVVWIDFNRANTYDEDHMTDKQKVLIAEEEESMEGFKVYMVRPLMIALITSLLFVYILIVLYVLG